MNLDAVTAELRPRETWEACDFGARMVRRDAAVIYKAWFILSLPWLALAVLATIYTPYPTLVLIIWWWFEPVFDGPILHVISRRLFGEQTDAKSALRATASSARRNWIFLFSPYRFHFARSLALPLTQLEGLAGAARRNRAKVLNQSTQNHGIGLTVAYQHLLLALYLGLILLGYAFIPEAYHDSVGLTWFDQFFSSDDVTAHLFALAFVYIGQTALHPWFVGAGFGLYINIRTILEAWDIEVAFRRMLQRRAARGVSAAAAIVLAAFLVAVSAPGASHAEVAELEKYWDSDEVQQATDEVYEADEFSRYETETKWVANNPKEEKPSEGDSSAIREFFESLGRMVSFLVEFGLWFVVAALLLLLFATRSRWLPYFNFQPQQRTKKERVILSSGAITAETLPDDIPAAVLRLWRAGEKREAAALLYRGTVFTVVTQHGIRLPPSATEGACMQAVDEQAAGQSGFFKRVVTAWMWCAYASRNPTDEAFEQLCNEWAAQYGAAP